MASKYGFIDKNGKVVIEPQFDYAGAFSEGLGKVKKDGKWGFIDKSGKVVIEPQFDSIFNFSEGLAEVEKDYYSAEEIARGEPPRADAQLRWWEQMLQKAKSQDKINAAQLERENEATKENEKTAKKYKKSSQKLKNIAKQKDEIAKKLEDAQSLLEKHSHIGQGPRKHFSLLINFIDNFDKDFSKNRKKEPTVELIAINLKKHLENHSTKPSFIINVEDGNDNCIKWRDDKGNIKCSLWGEAMRARITRIRKKRNKQ